MDTGVLSSQVTALGSLLEATSRVEATSGDCSRAEYLRPYPVTSKIVQLLCSCYGPTASSSCHCCLFESTTLPANVITSGRQGNKVHIDQGLIEYNLVLTHVGRGSEAIISPPPNHANTYFLFSSEPEPTTYLLRRLHCPGGPCRPAA